MKSERNELTFEDEYTPSVEESTSFYIPEEKYILKKTRRAKWFSLIMILMAVASIAVTVLQAKDIIPIGVNAFKAAYLDALNRTRTEEQDTIDYTHMHSFDIEIGNLHEISELVVLTVSDSEINIVNTDDNKDGIASWVRMTGYADYTVDMTKAEFITDSTRGHITVRIPEPVLGPVTPDYSGKEQLLTANKGANDNIAAGTSISEQQSTELKAQIEAALSSNEQNDQFAREEAITVVKNLLIDLNPELDIANITVEYFS